jgi:hypothetical protein
MHFPVPKVRVNTFSTGSRDDLLGQSWILKSGESAESRFKAFPDLCMPTL